MSIFIWLGAGILLAGCDRGIERIPVAGTVTYKGEPVATGQVLFFPAEGTETPMSGALLIDGSYEANANGGVPAGTHTVKIRGFRYHPKVVESGQTPDTVDMNDFLPKEQFIPEKYNKQTELRITLESGSGRVTKNFELVD